MEPYFDPAACQPTGTLHTPCTVAQACVANPNPEGVLIEPLHTTPEKVALVALGGSMNDHVREQMMTARMKQPYDEIWTLNRGIAGFHHHKLFMMDDMRWLAKRDPHYGGFMKRHKYPIITSTVYPEFPTAVPYPYVAVHEKIGDDIFNVNTVAYMVAYAIYSGVKELSIYGADFFYPNGSTAESGGQAVAFLLGLGRFFGMQFRLPASTTLLYANKVKQLAPGRVGRPPYGYHRRDQLSEEEKGIPLNQVG